MTAVTKEPPKLIGPRILKARTRTITDEYALKDAVEAYLDFDEFVFDIETKGEHRGDPFRNEVFWMTLAGPGRVDVIPMGHPTGDVVRIETPMRKDGSAPLKNAKPIPHTGKPPKQLWPGDVFSALEPLFFSERRKIGHNVKFDLKSIAKYYGGRLPPKPYGETMIATFLENENHLGAQPYGLDRCVQRAFQFRYDDHVPGGKKIRTELEKVPFSEAAMYCWLDGKWEWLLWRWALERLDKEGLLELLDLEMDVFDRVVRMEYRGCDINVDMIDGLDRTLQDEIAETYAKVNETWHSAGEQQDINLNANAQVSKLVYDIRKHKPRMFTDKKQEPSTAEKALEPYRHKDPVVDAVLLYAELHKLHATFVTGIKNSMYEGRVHAEFDQRGARTGRFSSRDPNLQNIPVRSERGRKIRELFVAPPGYKLIIADFSQIELRVLAHYSQDPLLIQAYQEGLDLHTITAQRGYHTEKPTYEQRAKAKNVNFSMAFRAGPQTLVDRYGIPSLREAQILIDAFFGTYRRVRPWSDALIRRCRQNHVSVAKAERLGIEPCPPYVETLLGRKRRLPGLMYNDRKQRSAAERQAINTIIQGSAADINKLAILAVGEWLDTRDWDWHMCGMVLTVHDELVTVVPEAEAEESRTGIQEAMEGVIELRVPLVADAKIADDWSEKG